MVKIELLRSEYRNAAYILMPSPHVTELELPCEEEEIKNALQDIGANDNQDYIIGGYESLIHEFLEIDIDTDIFELNRHLKTLKGFDDDQIEAFKFFTKTNEDATFKIFKEKILDLYREIDYTNWCVKTRFKDKDYYYERREHLNTHYNARRSLRDIFNIAWYLDLNIAKLQNTAKNKYEEYIRSEEILEERYIIQGYGVALELNILPYYDNCIGY